MKKIEMINGKTTLKTKDCEINIDVFFSVRSQRFEMIIPFTSGKLLLASDFLYGRYIGEVVIVDNTGQEFTAFECIGIKRITTIDSITIVGQYKTLIKGRDIPKNGMLSFHFEGMEQFLGDSTDISGGSLEREENKWILTACDGMIKAVTAIGKVQSLDLAISLFVKVREYFEYLVDDEILVDYVMITGEDGSTVEIMNDNRLMTERDIIFNKESLLKTDEIINGLNRWLVRYDTYKDVIHIWRKTIYNRSVSEEDVFIWRCQAFELLCTLYEPLFEAGGKYIKNPSKQPHPNPSNFLEGLNDIISFISCDNADFDDVKDVRNKYTHYNPQKHITERQWWNASHLIDLALKEAINYIFEIRGSEGFLLVLLPKGTKEEIRC